MFKFIRDYKNRKYQKWTNRERVWNYLYDNRWEWVSMLDFRDVCKVKHHNNAIYTIRKSLHFGIIEMKEEWAKNKYWDRKRNTYYRLVLPENLDININ